MDTNVPQVNTATFATRARLDELVQDLNHMKHVIDGLNDRLKSQTKAMRTRITCIEKALRTDELIG